MQVTSMVSTAMIPAFNGGCLFPHVLLNLFVLLICSPTTAAFHSFLSSFWSLTLLFACLLPAQTLLSSLFAAVSVINISSSLSEVQASLPAFVTVQCFYSIAFPRTTTQIKINFSDVLNERQPVLHSVLYVYLRNSSQCLATCGPVDKINLDGSALFLRASLVGYTTNKLPLRAFLCQLSYTGIHLTLP